MNVKRTSRQVNRIRENYLKMRAEFWPEISEELLWHRKEKKGFFSIPRCMTFIMLIMDELADVQVSSSYHALWCHTFDESLVIINNQEAIAFESGFTGQRAVNTWRSRIKELARLEFIKTASGGSGTYNYILILNPYKVIKKHHDEGKITSKASYNALFERATEIGAVEDL